jgi:hypothetical protein
MNFHGWVDFAGFGRAKFTDGNLCGFVLDSEATRKLHPARTESAQVREVSAANMQETTANAGSPRTPKSAVRVRAQRKD